MAEAELTGRVVRPEDTEYAAARAGWDTLFSAHPLAIVFAQSTGDVVNAIAWGRANRVALRVRSGRHHLQGWSNVTGGLVVDVSEFKDVALDADARTVRVGAGLTQGETVAALGAAGFAVPTGAEATVGLVGATLGGGFGLLTRAYGMACDNLLGAEVVVASGEVLEVDADHHPDLLWALRGAGNGNFGVVTALTYRIHPLAEIALVRAAWRGFGDLQAVFDAWQRSAPQADPRLTSVLDVQPDGFELLAVLAGDATPEEATALLQPVIGHGAPEISAHTAPWADTYIALQPEEGSELEQAHNWRFVSQIVDQPYPPEAIAVIAEFMAKAPTPICDYFCQSFGGAVRTPPHGGSAFNHRDALFYAEPGAGWSGDGKTDEAQAWTTAFSHALRPYVAGAYVNVPNAEQADWADAYWGDHYARLREIKTAYDPYDVFHHEQGIQPAGGR
jgi:FAD/FMN-containing dehydrogenase